jgi:5'-nucleotidase
LTPTVAPPAQQTVQPVVYDTPAPAMAAPAAATVGNGQYTVKKGDTLWKIAASHYGNGNQWQRIASANPGLSPTTLKIGQTIVIP